jgi:hypothetical protein
LSRISSNPIKADYHPTGRIFHARAKAVWSSATSEGLSKAGTVHAAGSKSCPGRDDGALFLEKARKTLGKGSNIRKFEVLRRKIGSICC